MFQKCVYFLAQPGGKWSNLKSTTKKRTNLQKSSSHSLIFQFPIYLEPGVLPDILACLGATGSKYIGNLKIRDCYWVGDWVCKAYVMESPSPKQPYKVQYHHFRYLELFLIVIDLVGSVKPRAGQFCHVFGSSGTLQPGQRRKRHSHHGCLDRHGTSPAE